MSSNEDILFEVGPNGVAWLTFNRPAARNALTLASYARLESLVEGVRKNRDVRVLMMRGAGDKAFVSGTDIAEFRAFSTEEHALGYEAMLTRMLDALEELEIPTVAVIQGACTGGGAAVAAACDLRIGDPSARFGFPIARTLGNTLSTRNLARLSAMIGVARTKDIPFLSRLMNAEEMHAAGLLNEVVPSDRLYARADELAQTLLEQAPLTLLTCRRELLRVILGWEPPSDTKHVVDAYMSADFKEGMDAFLNKRRPKWQGR